MNSVSPDNSDAEAGRDSKAVDRILGSKASIPIALGVLAAALLFAAYVARDYFSSQCFAQMRTAGLARETAELFEETGIAMADLRNGTALVAKWNDAAFQKQIEEIHKRLAHGRQALSERDAFAALDSIVELEKGLAQAKALATDRVNFILAHQDPNDYDAFERYRLEGKNLVAVVKSLDSVLQTLDNRSKKLPNACNW